MKNPIKDTMQNHPYLKYLYNRYVLALVGFCIWLLFLDNYSFIEHQVLNKQIDALEDNKEYYQEEIKKDKKRIKDLQDSYRIEQYAREKYYMKRDSEDIYIIDIEKDRIADSILEAGR